MSIDLKLGSYIVIAMACLLLGSPRARATLSEGDPRVFLTQADALRIMLPGADTVQTQTLRITPDARARVERRSGRRLGEDTVAVWVGRRAGAVSGYGFIVSEIGLHHPITFGIGLDSRGKLVDCVVMVFRESRGSEIRDPRFRRQLQGKGPEDPIRLNRDVISITGATYSSRAATDAIRKAMALRQELLR